MRAQQITSAYKLAQDFNILLLLSCLFISYFLKKYIKKILFKIINKVHKSLINLKQNKNLDRTKNSVLPIILSCKKY